MKALPKETSSSHNPVSNASQIVNTTVSVSDEVGRPTWTCDRIKGLAGGERLPMLIQESSAPYLSHDSYVHSRGFSRASVDRKHSQSEMDVDDSRRATLNPKSREVTLPARPPRKFESMESMVKIQVLIQVGMHANFQRDTFQVRIKAIHSLSVCERSTVLRLVQP